jgi:hypothetical protein
LIWALESQQRVGFCDIVTGDKSWFLQYYGHRQILCISADDVPTRVAHTITAQKNNADCILKYRQRHLNQLAHAQGKIQQLLRLRKALEPLSEILHGGRAARSPKPILRFDNAIPHRSAATENCFQLCQF